MPRVDLPEKISTDKTAKHLSAFEQSLNSVASGHPRFDFEIQEMKSYSNQNQPHLSFYSFFRP